MKKMIFGKGKAKKTNKGMIYTIKTATGFKGKKKNKKKIKSFEDFYTKR